MLPNRLPKLTWWVVWGALLLAVIIYLVVLTTGPASKASRGENFTTFRSTLLTVALAQLVISFGIRFLVTRRLDASGRPRATGMAFGSYIASLALAEACAIYGMLLGLMGATPSEYGIFFALGFAGLLFQPPTFKGIEREPQP